MKLLKYYFSAFIFLFFAFGSFANQVDIEIKNVTEAVIRGDLGIGINNMVDKLLDLASSKKYLKDHKKNKEKIGELFRDCYRMAAYYGHKELMYNFILRFEQWRGSRRIKPLELGELSDLLAHAALNTNTSMLEEVYNFAKSRHDWKFSVRELEEAFRVSLNHLRHMHIDFFVEKGFNLNEPMTKAAILNSIDQPKSGCQVKNSRKALLIRALIKGGLRLDFAEQLLVSLENGHNDDKNPLPTIDKKRRSGNASNDELMKKREAIRKKISSQGDFKSIKDDIAQLIEASEEESGNGSFIRISFWKFCREAAKVGHKNLDYFIDRYKEKVRGLITRRELAGLLRSAAMADDNERTMEVMADLAKNRYAVQFSKEEVLAAFEIALASNKPLNNNFFKKHKIGLENMVYQYAGDVSTLSATTAKPKNAKKVQAQKELPSFSKSMMIELQERIRAAIKQGNCAGLESDLETFLAAPATFNRRVREGQHKFYFDAAEAGHLEQMVYFVGIYQETLAEREKRHMNRNEWAALLRKAAVAEENEKMLQKVYDLAFKKGIIFSEEEIKVAFKRAESAGRSTDIDFFKTPKVLKILQR